MFITYNIHLMFIITVILVILLLYQAGNFSSTLND
jgi:hypothetical protein